MKKLTSFDEFRRMEASCELLFIAALTFLKEATTDIGTIIKQTTMLKWIEVFEIETVQTTNYGMTITTPFSFFCCFATSFYKATNLILSNKAELQTCC